MSSKRRPGNKPSSPQRSMTSVMGISFAIAMAFFLVIGMVAVAVPEFLGGGGNDDAGQQLDGAFDDFDDEGESEEQDLRDRLEEDPDDDSAMAQLAVLLANTGRLNESITWYERALDHRPDDVSLRISFARTLQQQGYDLDAEIQLDRILDEDPENEEAMFMLAEVMERDDPPRQDEADELYEQIIEVAPDSFYAQMAEERLAGEPEGDSDLDLD